MKIKEGAYYRTRDGDVVGPMAAVSGCNYTFTAIGYTWNEDGSFVRGNPYKLDFVSEVYVSDTPPADAPAPEAKTLRDEFAMAALTGVMAQAVDDGNMGSGDWASDAYFFADMMMEARKK